MLICIGLRTYYQDSNNFAPNHIKRNSATPLDLIVAIEGEQDVKSMNKPPIQEKIVGGKSEKWS